MLFALFTSVYLRSKKKKKEKYKNFYMNGFIRAIWHKANFFLRGKSVWSQSFASSRPASVVKLKIPD